MVETQVLRAVAPQVKRAAGAVRWQGGEVGPAGRFVAAATGICGGGLGGAEAGPTGKGAVEVRGSARTAMERGGWREWGAMRRKRRIRLRGGRSGSGGGLVQAERISGV